MNSRAHSLAYHRPHSKICNLLTIAAHSRAITPTQKSETSSLLLLARLPSRPHYRSDFAAHGRTVLPTVSTLAARGNTLVWPYMAVSAVCHTLAKSQQDVARHALSRMHALVPVARKHCNARATCTYIHAHALDILPRTHTHARTHARARAHTHTHKHTHTHTHTNHSACHAFTQAKSTRRSSISRARGAQEGSMMNAMMPRVRRNTAPLQPLRSGMSGHVPLLIPWREYAVRQCRKG
jgi:hypothetical protein